MRSLSEGATYEAWVAAHSVAGEGEPSAPQPATTTSRGIWLEVYNLVSWLDEVFHTV